MFQLNPWSVSHRPYGIMMFRPVRHRPGSLSLTVTGIGVDKKTFTVKQGVTRQNASFQDCQDSYDVI